MILKAIPKISFFCVVFVSCGVDFAILIKIIKTLVIVIVIDIVLGVNGP